MFGSNECSRAGDLYIVPRPSLKMSFLITLNRSEYRCGEYRMAPYLVSANSSRRIYGKKSPCMGTPDVTTGRSILYISPQPLAQKVHDQLNRRGSSLTEHTRQLQKGRLSGELERDETQRREQLIGPSESLAHAAGLDLPYSG
jgi:hypothetical protein